MALLMTRERWKPVPHTIYQASNFGRIRSWRGVLKQFTQGGYRKSYAGYTARLVALAWIGPPQGRLVGYRDGRKSNCRLSNLYYRSVSGIAAESYIRGRATMRGERHGMAILTEPQVLEILDLLRTYSQVAVANQYGVSRQTIGAIARGENWSWLTQERTARRAPARR